MGSAWYYVLAASAYRGIEPPYILGGLGILYGYFRAMLTGHARYENPEYRRYLRRFERAQLFRGKRRAVAEENERLRQGPVPGQAA